MRNQQDFVRVLEAAELPEDFRLYDLRHTAAYAGLRRRGAADGTKTEENL